MSGPFIYNSEVFPEFEKSIPLVYNSEVFAVNLLKSSSTSVVGIGKVISNSTQKIMTGNTEINGIGTVKVEGKRLIPDNVIITIKSRLFTYKVESDLIVPKIESKLV